MGKFDSLEGIRTPLVKRILPRYVKIIKGDVPAKFELAKRIVFDFHSGMSSKKMWEEHEHLMRKFRHTQLLVDKGKIDIDELEVPRFSLIDMKAMLTEDMAKSCSMCERMCAKDRTKNRLGYCKVGKEFVLSSESIQKGEEAHISPSHMISLMGCNFNCQFCQNWQASQWRKACAETHPTLVARAIKRRIEEGARNVNWTGGEPTPHIANILKSLKGLDASIPQIWNSNFYMSERSMKILDGVVDMYLSDFKYGNNDCGRSLSQIDDYFEVCARNHMIAASHAEITIRHLVMPEHFECCTKPVFDWIRKNLRAKAVVSILGNYTPSYMAKERIDIGRAIMPEELEEAVSYAKKLKLNYVS